MEINLEVLDEGPFTSIPTRRRGSGVAYFLGRMCPTVAYLIRTRDIFTVIEFIVTACYFMVRKLIGRVREFIGRGWGKVGPLIFMVAVKWERAFVLSCIAVSLDPLFLYIPIVDETNKCLAMDRNLKPIALILRSLTDFLLITHIIAQICNWVRTDHPKYSERGPVLDDPEFYPDREALNPVVKFVKHTLPWSIIIKFLAVLPVPQVGILVGFFRMRGSDFLVNRKFLNVSLVLQYLPRVCQIYLIKSEFSAFRMAGKWMNPLFNLFLYFLASHVLGALWYFFAIQRETSCWYKACRKTQGCVAGSYNCGDSGGAKNITFLDQLCPINSPNSTRFDFGIFVKILQSGNTGSDKFVTKLFYSSWWGLKNLSNFGTNLETSSYLWENCFAILICVIGLLLFLYLIGNVQLYIQSSTQKLLDKEQSRADSIQRKKADITKWMEKKFPPPDHDELRKRIKRNIREDKVVEKNLSHDMDVDIEYFLKSGPSRIRKPILGHLGVAALAKAKSTKGPEGSRYHPESSKKTNKILLGDIMDETKLKSLCQLMEPVVYTANSPVVKLRGRLDKMLFIIEGQLRISKTKIEGPRIMIVGKNKYYGQDILKWALLNYTTRSYYDLVPRSTRYVNAGRAKVEALGLDAWNLLRFIEKNVDINSPKLKELALSARETDQMRTEDQLSRDPTVEWKSPDRGWVKLNCTSLWDTISKTARLGGILRNDEGALIEAGSCCSQTCIDEFEAAAYSIKSYIKFHPRFVSTKIVVESDNKLLVDCLNNWPSSSKKRVRYSLQSTLDYIISVASKFKSSDSPTFVHCNPQTNEAAVQLAEHAESTPVTWTADKIPEWLDPVLKKNRPPPKEQKQQPAVKSQKQEPVPKAQKQEPVLKVQNQDSVSKVQNQELVTQDSEAASDKVKTSEQPLALLLKNT